MRTAGKKIRNTYPQYRIDFLMVKHKNYVTENSVMENHNNKYAQRQERTIRNLSSFFKKHLESRPGQAEERRNKKCHDDKNGAYYRTGSAH